MSGNSRPRGPRARTGKLATTLLASTTLIGTTVGLTALASPAGAATTRPDSYPAIGPAVFAANDNPAGNQIFVYHRAADGILRLAGGYATGGFGGVTTGSVFDHLGSQAR